MPTPDRGLFLTVCRTSHLRGQNPRISDDAFCAATRRVGFLGLGQLPGGSCPETNRSDQRPGMRKQQIISIQPVNSPQF